jgi:peptide/nickel transport system permease protein
MAENTAKGVVRLKDETIYKSLSMNQRAVQRLWRDKLTMTALIILGIISLLVLFADPICQYILKVDPNATNPSIRLLAPFQDPAHILGTDDLGRDYAARLLFGGQVSLAIGFFGSIITLLIGTVVGLLSGYLGGFVDDLMNWIITTLDSIPAIYLLMIIATVLTRSATTLVIVIALTSWTADARLVRGQTIQIRSLDYVLSARALGAGTWRIMWAHIFPNTLSLQFLVLASGIGGLIISESTLSFLKLGVQPPTPTWGNMLTNAQQFFSRGPHMATISGLLIFITVLCLYVIGDGLRDAFDPRTVD